MLHHHDRESERQQRLFQHDVIHELRRIARALEKRVAMEPPAEEIEIDVSVDKEVPDSNLKGNMPMYQGTLTVGAMQNLKIAPRNVKLNKPAKIDGIPEWSVILNSGVTPPTLTPAADGLSCIAHGGKLEAGNVAQIAADFDTDLGEGKKIYRFIFELTSVDVEADDAGASVDPEVADTDV